MTTDLTPAAELRAAASLLREAAGHATPGPWRTHDTHLGSAGGHTATVLTDRPNINDTELIAWLPTMSHEPWDETRNAWRNAGWMALMDPSVGLALAELLGTAARFASLHADLFTASTGRAPTEADLDKPIGDALVVARRVLGTTEQAAGAPCTWPSCLSAEQQTALADEVLSQMSGNPASPATADPCVACGCQRADGTTEQADTETAPEVEAHRPLTEWIAEVQEDDGLWMYLGSDPDRSVAEKRRASVTRRHPGVETRTVRKTTTYTVAAEAQQPTPAVAEAQPVIAYRDPNNPHMLFCRTHGERWAGLSPLTSHDLPHGGICTLGHASGDKCGRDALSAITEETK